MKGGWGGVGGGGDLRDVVLAAGAQVVVHAVIPHALLLLAGELVLARLREVDLQPPQV